VNAAENGGSLDWPAYTLQIRLDSKIKELKLDLKIDGPIWSPAVYRDVAGALSQAVGLTADPAENHDDTSLISTLLDATPETIERQNGEVSEALESDFTNAELHEKAALLLGAFVMRENSGYFFEIRSPLSRITAHLAMAQFLRGTDPFSINGKMAETLMLTRVNDETPALDLLRDMKTNDVAVVAMARALRARNTGNYLELSDTKDKSAFESIECFHAMADYLGTSLAWPKLSDEQRQSIDYVRIANDIGYSVQIGHELLEVSVPLETREIKSIYEMAHPGQTLPLDMTKVLNEFPEHCFEAESGGKVHVHVIGWGQWAMFFQRQLCHAIQQNFYLMNGMWGVPEDAKEFAARCEQSFGGLTLYPFVRRFNCMDVDSYHKAVDDAFKMTVSMPQYISANCWNHLCYRPSFAAVYIPVSNPHINEWHNHNPLPGTLYDLGPRLNHPSLTDRGDVVADFERLHELAPYDGRILNFLVKKKYNDQLNYDQAMMLYHEMLPYWPGALRAVANSVGGQPEKYEPLMKRAGELDPLNYYYLANYMRNRNLEDKAAEYDQKAFDNDPDRVRSANSVEWLVRYYLRHNRKPKAAEVAADAGSSYSFRGLQTQAIYFEETSNYDSALAWFATIDERYNDAYPVVNFCLRYKTKTGNTRFDSEVTKRLNKLFPKGMAKVSLADFKAPPVDGVSFQEQNALMESVGLKKGDVIVAVYGVPIHNVTQYTYGRSLKETPALDLIVWQGDAYREITASPPKHLFGVNIDNYSVQQ
jgi:tetratricopeptide (TPR) repeat protein